MQRKALISSVQPDSIAEELGITSGDAVIQVNGQDFHDLIDLSFAFATETLDLVVEKASGEIVEFDIEKDFDEELGIEFETAVFDGVRRCANHCIFCFVDQMPAGMRQSLYVKDDDYRLSFLYGNFITLSNLMPQDMERIHRLHLSPLYVSVHTTDGELRSRMLNNERAGQIMEQLQGLYEQDIEFHGQIVLCPGFNDGAVLKKTFEDVLNLYPTALSLAAVPVGLTKYREECFSMDGFTPEQAADVIDMVSTWQAECRKKIGKSFIYLADEFYLAANRTLPSSEEYDGFPQLENGVGLVRNFLDEWEETVSSRAAEFASAGYDEPITLDLACGVSAAKIIGPLLDQLTIRNLTVRVLPIENQFFGQQITVTGLLTAGDIIEQVKSAEKNGDGLIIPGVALRKGENVFLDEQKPEDVAKALNRPVRAAWSPVDLLELLLNWR